MLRLTIISSIFLGPSAAMTASLGVGVCVFFLMVVEYPHLQTEFVPFLTSTGIILLMTICCVVGFLGLPKKLTCRWWGQGAI